MHRALGGASTSRGQWRSLGRSLLANAMRVRRSWCCGRVGAAATPASSPDTFLQAKNKIFREVRPLSRLLRSKSPYGAGCCASPVQCLKIQRQNLVRSNFAASKNKEEIF